MSLATTPRGCAQPRAKDGDDRASALAPGRAGGARADESEDDPATQDTVPLPSDSEEELDEEDDDEPWTESDEEEGEDGGAPTSIIRAMWRGRVISDFQVTGKM